MDSNNPFFQLSRNHCLGPASGAQQIVSRKNLRGPKNDDTHDIQLEFRRFMGMWL